MRIITLLVVVATLMSTCIRHQEMPDDEIAALFAEIRSDTVWISHLDSLASIAIGPGARCLDPVSHSFLYDDRIWLYNQDWGGVLELPSDYIIEDDPLQAELSFHGTRAFSPDSMAIVSFYAGFQVLDYDHYISSIESSLFEAGFSVVQLYDDQEAITLRTRNIEGINCYGRFIYKSIDGVEYSVSIQYHDAKSQEANTLIQMAEHYPSGPSGIGCMGEAFSR